jgi:hypothetical protein
VPRPADPYTCSSKPDEFFWIANGTSDSKYTFVLKARVIQR